LDTENGKLIPTSINYTTQPGSGPRHLTFHPFKSIAYVVNELNGTIECMRVDTLTGALTKFQTISTLAEGNSNEASCADIHIAPSGNYLYASNRGPFNNIAMYSINSKTGELSLIGHQSVKGKTPRNFIIDPSGTYLLVANQDSDNVVTFRIDQETGKLIDIGVEASMPAPVCLKFLPNKP
jgi:6-phosphogluconolactonase